MRGVRAEQVGSLLRPPELLRARAAHAEGRLSDDELRAGEDGAIRAAIERQRQTGIDVYTDGEMRRGSWLTDMAEAVDGFVAGSAVLEWKGPGGGPERSTAQAVGGKLCRRRMLTARELPLLKALAATPFKVTLPAPSNFVVAGFKRGLTDAYYASRGELLADLAAIVRDEIHWLITEGVTYIQLDAPFYSHYLDPRHREAIQSAGGNPDREFAEAVAGDNAALAAVAPRDAVTLAVHVCRGNSRSRWYTEGGYEAIAERLFGSLAVNRFLLEYDNARAGGFEPLRLVPPGKDVVLGLVTTKEPALEREDDLARHIDDAARYVPLERLALSPQCGFASVAAGNLLSTDDQWRQLELVVRTAERVWGNR